MADIKYKRLDDESYDNYWWRICLNKDLNVYDLTWDEVGKILNAELDEEFSSSKWRKNYQMMKKGFDKAREQNIETEEMIEEIELKRMELKEERVRLSTLRLDLNKKISNSARFKQWIEEIKQASQSIKIEIPKYKGVEIDNCDKDYILTVADIHTGKKGEALNNYYDLDVLQSRMWQIRDETIEIIKEKQIKTLKILALGDLIDGILRASQIQHLQILRAEQVVFIVRFLFEWLNSLSEFCHIDFKMTTSSNHSESRPLNSKAGEFSNDDYELIIYEWLCDLCKNNLRINIEGNDILEFDILNRPVIAMHGHQLNKIKSRTNILADVSFHMNKQYQYMFIGHLHHTNIKAVGKNELGNKEIIYCPCICGNDDFSDSLWTGASAGSLFIEFLDKGNGKIRKSVTDILVE